MVIAAKLLPTRYRSPKVTHLFELVDKNQQRMDHALDIRTMVESHEDLVLFIRKFIGKEQLWLFKR